MEESNPKTHNFFKSSFSGGGGCVGVCFDGDDILVVDLKSKDQILKFNNVEWSAFIKGVKSNEFDLPLTRGKEGT